MKPYLRASAQPQLALFRWLARTYPHWFRLRDHRREHAAMLWRIFWRITAEEAGE